MSSASQPGLFQLRPRTWWRVLTRSLRGFKQDNCVDLAAALTYWGLLSMFPAALVVVALVGLVAASEDAIQTIIDVIGELAPATMTGVVEDQVQAVVGGRTAAGVLFSFGILGAVWTASAYLRSFTRAANTIYEVEEGRPAYRLIPMQLGLTVVLLALAAAVVAGLVVSGPVAQAIGGAIGFEETGLAVWKVVKWPVLVLIAGLLLSLLFWVAPNVRRPKLTWFTVGSVVALLVWVLVSVGFGLYVANFGTYNATYGALGAIIVFLIWMFLGNCAILLGVEINAELQRGRRMQAGQSPDPEAPPLPPKAHA